MRPLPPPRDLTIPEPGSITARVVLSHAIGRLLRELGPLLREHAASAPEDVVAVEAALSRLPEVAPLFSVLRRPHVGGLVRALRATRPGEGGPILVELLATDPGSTKDVAAWCRATSNELVEQTVDGAVFRFVIRRK